MLNGTVGFAASFGLFGAKETDVSSYDEFIVIVRDSLQL